MPGEIIFQNPYPSNNQLSNANLSLGENHGTIASVSSNSQIMEQEPTSKMDLGNHNSNNYQNGEIPIYLNQNQNTPTVAVSPEVNRSAFVQTVDNQNNPIPTIGLNEPLVNQKKANSSVISVLFFIWLLVGGYYFLGGNINLDFLKGQFGIDLESTGLKNDLENLSGLGGNSSDQNIVISDPDSLENYQTDEIDKIFLANESKYQTTQKFPITKASYNQNDVDTDLDSISDQAEKVLGTDPYNSDSDGDNISDYQEISIYKTNPLKNDTDGDGINDLTEILGGKDPNRNGF